MSCTRTLRSCCVATSALWLAPAVAQADSGLRETLTGLALGLADHPCGAVVAVFGYALAGVLFVPVNLLAAVTLAVFGVWPGILVAWLGGLLGAALSHTLGWRLGPRAMRWIPERVRLRLDALAHHRAFWVVVLMRILPVGNFGAFNLLAGAFRLPRPAFVLGNMLGLVPGLLGLGAIVDRVSAALRQPGVLNLVLLGLALALVIGGLLWLRTRYRTVIEVSRE